MDSRERLYSPNQKQPDDDDDFEDSYYTRSYPPQSQFTPQQFGQQPRQSTYAMSPKASYQSDVSFGDIESTAHSSADKHRRFAPPEIPSQPLWQSVLPDSMSCRLFVLVVVLETLVDLVVEGDLLLRFHQMSEQDPSLDKGSIRRLSVYFSIFVFAHVFQFVMAIDAVRMRNTLQFLFLTAFNALFLVYAIIQISEIQNAWPTSVDTSSGRAIKVLTTIIPCVISVAELAFIVLGWSIWREFGWKVYKLLGADVRIKKVYMQFQIFDCLLKFDVMFVLGFSAQLIFLVLQKTDAEFYITIIALPVSLLILLVGRLAAQHENKPLMYFFMFGVIAGSGYFGYKLFRIIEQRDNDNYKPVFKSLTTFAALSLLFMIATFTWTCIVTANFGAGLKNNLSRSKTRAIIRKGGQRQDVDFSGPDARRMSIE